MTLVPAYGRDYRSKAAVLADFDADKDFEAVGIGGGGYVNKSQLLKMGVREVSIRYKKLTMQIIHGVK